MFEESFFDLRCEPLLILIVQAVPHIFKHGCIRCLPQYILRLLGLRLLSLYNELTVSDPLFRHGGILGDYLVREHTTSWSSMPADESLGFHAVR